MDNRRPGHARGKVQLILASHKEYGKVRIQLIMETMLHVLHELIYS